MKIGTQSMRVTITTTADERRVADQRCGRAAGERSRIPCSCRPTSAKSSALTMNVEDLPERVARDARRSRSSAAACTSPCRRRSSRRRARPRRRARSRAGRRGSRRAARSRPRSARRRRGGAPGARRSATASPTAIPPTTFTDEVPRGVPERERPGDRGGDSRLVEHERETVVDEALALDDRDDAARHADPADDLGRGERVGGRDDRAERERARPGETRHGRVTRPPRRRTSSLRRAEGQQRDRAQVRLQVAQAGEERRRVEQRRQDRDEHEIRRQLEVRQPRNEAEHEAAGHEEQREAGKRHTAATTSIAASAASMIRSWSSSWAVKWCTVGPR